MTSLTWVLIGAVIVLGAALLRQRFASFLAQRPSDYADGQPHFDIRQHLKGAVVCDGVLYGPLGRVTSRFVADFDVSWYGNIGIMKEHFCYDDGSTQDREWRLSVGNDGRISATAPDVIGTGTGMQMGSALKLNYRIQLPADAGGHILNTTDWMYLTPNGTIVNRSQFRKFGIQVAELVATLRPKETA